MNPIINVCNIRKLTLFPNYSRYMKIVTSSMKKLSLMKGNKVVEALEISPYCFLFISARKHKIKISKFLTGDFCEG